MRVNHGCGHMFVSEKFLNRPNIVRWIASLIAAFEQMCSKAVAQGMG